MPKRSHLFSMVLPRLTQGRAQQSPAPEDHAPPPVSERQRMEVLGRLAGRFSHEFNNQLGIISNSAHLIGRKARDPGLTLPAQAMLRSVEVASGLAQRLQRLGSRHPSGAQPLELAAWLIPLLPALAMVLGKRMAFGPGPVEQGLRVHIAPDELELALTSMLLCARDMLPDGARVTIEARRVEGGPGQLPAGAHAQLGIEAVADGGRRPVEPIRAVGEDGEALGLGLACSLAASAGGGLWVAADPGHSLCARLVLPQMRA